MENNMAYFYVLSSFKFRAGMEAFCFTVFWSEDIV